MRYHLVYQMTSGEKILVVDTDQEPPKPGDSLQLPSAPDERETKQYVVNHVYFDPHNPLSMTVFIEIDPMSGKKPT